MFLIIIALSVQTCDLKEHSYTEAGKDNYPLTAAEAETVLMGIYQHMEKEGMYAYHLSLLFTISSDIAQCEGSATSSFRAIPTNTHTASLNEISVSWQELYSAIYDANDFIETVSQRMESWDEANRSLATVYLAEARALRALFYFELLRWWGNVPLVRTTSESRQAASLYRQATPEEVFAFIENDLKWAKIGVMGVEMEGYSLYLNAARAGKNALVLATVSDHLVKKQFLSPEDRQYSFDEMIIVALETAAELH